MGFSRKRSATCSPSSSPCSSPGRTRNSSSSLILGRGSFGTVRLVKEEEGFLAMKVLSSKHYQSALSEAKLLSLLQNHENIVKFHSLELENSYSSITSTSASLSSLSPSFLAAFSSSSGTTTATTVSSSSSPLKTSTLDLTEDSGEVRILMEYIEGVSLSEFQLRKGGALPESKVRIIFQQLLSAISYAHSQGICHLDLKPTNCMIVRDNSKPEGLQVKLLDWGLGVQLPSATSSSTPSSYVYLNDSRGTLEFTAPELLSKGLCSAKADMWSLGVILFHLLTGTSPFLSANSPSTQWALRDEIFYGEDKNFKLPFGKVSEQAVDLLRSLLRRDGNLRLSAKKALQHPWVNPTPDAVCPSLSFSFVPLQASDSWVAASASTPCVNPQLLQTSSAVSPRGTPLSPRGNLSPRGVLLNAISSSVRSLIPSFNLPSLASRSSSSKSIKSPRTEGGIKTLGVRYLFSQPKESVFEFRAPDALQSICEEEEEE